LGNYGSRHYLAVMLRNGQGGPEDKVRARALFEKLVAENSARAMEDLASMLHAGEGGPKDEARAQKLIERLGKR